MKTWPILTVALDHENDIVAVRQRARRIAELLGFEGQDQTRIATATSEIARNAYTYGKGGRAELGLEGRRTPESFTIRISDRGPGFADLEAVIEGRYQSVDGLGLGITGARRLMDRFHIAEAPAGGAVVSMSRALPNKAAAVTADRLGQIGKILTQETAGDPMAELRAQNLELIQSLQALEARRLEAEHLTRELERTNQGVVALYAELDQRSTELESLNANLEARVAEGMAARERIEESLRQSQKMEAVGQLTGGIAHDFNNLLMVIGGSLEMLRRRVPNEPPITRLLDAAAQGVARGGALNQQLLAFARRQDLRMEVVAVSDFLPSCRALIERAVSEDITIEVKGDGEGLYCRTDPHQLETAILNLTINARDAMPGGGVLTLSAARALIEQDEAERIQITPGDYITITVSDTGEGIPEDVVERVFEPFFTTKEVGRGTGLGLSQVYGFAKQSGGAVTIVSALGQGAQVMIHLPAADKLELVAADAVEAHRIEGAAVILLVEDEPSVRAVTSAMLMDLGYTVIQATSGRQALDTLAGREVDLVFSDVILPDGMNGVDLAKHIADVRPALPVLLTSGYTAQRLNLAEDKGLRILHKPYSEARLSEAISQALRK